MRGGKTPHLEDPGKGRVAELRDGDDVGVAKQALVGTGREAGGKAAEQLEALQAVEGADAAEGVPAAVFDPLPQELCGAVGAGPPHGHVVDKYHSCSAQRTTRVNVCVCALKPIKAQRPEMCGDGMHYGGKMNPKQAKNLAPSVVLWEKAEEFIRAAKGLMALRAGREGGSGVEWPHLPVYREAQTVPG